MMSNTSAYLSCYGCGNTIEVQCFIALFSRMDGQITPAKPASTFKHYHLCADCAGVINQAMKQALTSACVSLHQQHRASLKASETLPTVTVPAIPD